MADFKLVIPKIFRHEGVTVDAAGNPVPGKTGYSDGKTGDYKKDRGGETNYGITVAVARANGYMGPMIDIPLEIVLTIYKREYWDVIRGDEISDQAIAEEIFDTGVNMGQDRTKRYLQRTLNVLNKQEKLWRDIPVDGQFGPVTIATLETALAARPEYKPAILLALNCLQGSFYIEFTERDPNQEPFMLGWLLQRVRLDG